MKICLYSPYIPKHFGGGEKYILDVAEVLSHRHQVVIAISESVFKHISPDEIKTKYESFFAIDLSKVEFVSSPLGEKGSQLQKISWTKQFDCLYYVSDGSLFFSLARKNILHIQIPFTVTKSGSIDRLKLANWSVKNTNSEFTKKVVEKAWQTHIDMVHHPMVEMPWKPDFASLKAQKQATILNVGRFFTQLHSKRQDVLITFFKSLCDERPRLMQDWKLYLVGGVEDEKYAEELHNQAIGYPIEFFHQVNRETLLKYYQQASIYWHAAGFDVNEELNPEKVEHFGISTVEAMASGAAPVVINKGGQPEILGSELKKWLWNDTEEVLTLTKNLLENETLLSQTQEMAFKRAQVFNREAFKTGLSAMLGVEV